MAESRRVKDAEANYLERFPRQGFDFYGERTYTVVGILTLFMMQTMQCTVLVSSRSPGIGNGLSYETGDLTVQPGSFVRVPLRKKTVDALVLEIEDAKKEEAYALKKIEEILSGEPLLNMAQMKTMRWIASTYWCSLRGALGAFLPSTDWKSLLPKEETFYTLNAGTEPPRGKKLLELWEYMQGKERLSRKALKEEAGASSATIKALLEKGILHEETVAGSLARDNKPYELAAPRPVLSPLQEEVYRSMSAETRPSLLFGITGSGKTEIYASMIADAAARGKQSILLVPEILLTEHTIHRFETLFDRDKIAILHSRLTPAGKRNEWRRIRSGEAALVIGSRSALFAPCPNLGLVLIDEEHEWTYKNEQTPRYHARETAETLCRYAGAKLVLGSATPSIESWARTKSGQYHLARLPERYRNQALPNVRIIDLGTVRFGDMYPFSPPLLEAIGERIARGEQSILFLNRRGMATALLCLQCRRRVMSPDTQLPFTVHRTPMGQPFLLDHFSGAQANFPASCPSCGSHELRAVGAGTQKIEDILAAKFPGARILRADSDTLRHPEQMRLLLKKMRERQADILFGTQAVVKGLDLPDVTLAAVLLADIGLSLPHFRAGERVFQLLTQLTGRSGRAKSGEVIVQTFRPDAPEVLFAAKHETERYMEEELKLRLALKYPPATQMVRFLLDGPNATQRARTLLAQIQKQIAERGAGEAVMCAPTLFGGGKVWHLLLRGPGPRTMLPKLDLTDVTVDVDPVDCI
jgi:primosomal protein N' (replication factor Y) (superfamily II helicase)